MLRLLLLFSLLALCPTLTFSQSVPPAQAALKDKLDMVVATYAKNGNFNGAVLVAKKGTVLLEKGYGYRNIEKQTANSENSIFRIGQLTEAFTSEIVLKLDSKGLLGLDDKVSKYIPDFPEGQKISVRNLLTHTSGIPGYVPDTALQRNQVCRPMNMETFVEFYKKTEPVNPWGIGLFEPGYMYNYSNADYMLLGFIIGKIAKIFYDDEVGYKILSVCAMRHSGFEFFGLKDGEKATGYYCEADRCLPVQASGDTAILYPANAMYSTVGDLYKCHEALRWYKLLPKDWQELAYVPFKNLPATQSVQYALGWNIEKMYNKRFMEQEGSFSGFTSSLVRQEEDDVCIIVLENKMQAGYRNMGLAKDLLKVLYGPEPKKTEKKEPKTPGEHPAKKEPKAPDEHPVKPEAHPLKKYVGKFIFNTDYPLIFSLKGDDLTVESPDEQPILLIPDSGTVFKTKGAEVRIEFVPDGKGAVNKAILHQNGQDYTGKREK